MRADRLRRASAKLAVGCVIGALAAGAPARGATQEAWDAFRADVQQACLAEGAKTIESPAIVVDPFGTQSYGLALMTGMEQGGAEVRSVICVYDKQAKTVQVSGSLDLATSAAPGREARVAQAAREDEGTSVGTIAPFSGQCTEECEATLSVMDAQDQRKLTRLPQVIAQTIVENPKASGERSTDSVRDVALSLSELIAGTPTEGLSAPRRAGGKSACTVYYYGFMGEPAKMIGRHTCTVSSLEGGGLLVEKTTGERLRAEIRPLTDGFSAFVGRNFLADQEERQYDPANPANAANANFGNVVGMATQMGSMTYLMSSEQRGAEAEDPTFFWVLAIGG